jgi:very-long-chain enoyl-CoA reductase
MRPRVHNLLSYSVCLLVFWVTLAVRGRSDAGWSANASLGAALWSAHFLRRSLESAFVHRYGKPRVGLGDAILEYVYYWGFAGWIAWSLADPSHPAPALLWQGLGGALFIAAEAGNLRSHLILRRLRSPSGHEKGIPRGFLFERLSCPHYACEIASWVGFSMATGAVAALCFMLLGAVILAGWARSRHLAYRREFDGQHGRELYPVGRRALVPYLF